MTGRPRVRRERWWIGLALSVAIVATNAGYVASSVGFVHSAQSVLETDHHRYIEMAKGASHTAWRGLAYEPPFCYRVLTPWLVARLVNAGVDADMAWYAFTHLCLALFLFTLYLYLTTFDLDLRECLLGVVLTGLLQGAGRWYSYQYWMTDPLALFLIALAFLLIRTERTAWLLGVSVVAVMARESYVLVFPYFFFRTLRREGLGRAVERTLAVAIAPLVVLGLIRASAAALEGPGILRLLRFFVVWRFERLFDNQLYLWTIGSFGVLLPLFWLWPVQAARELGRRYEDLAVLAVVFGSLFVGNNTDRLLAYALPVVVPPAMANFHRVVASGRLPFFAVATGALIVQSIVYDQTLWNAWRAVSVSQPANAAATAAVLGFWVMIALADRLGSTRASEPA